MYAAYINELGSADDIRYGEFPEPRPGPTDVLVDVIATTVNPVDTFVRSGVFRTPIPFPFIIGRDVVGTVAAHGLGAAGFAVGDRVWCNSLGHDGRQGAAAERVVVPVDRLYRLPEEADPVQAVATVHPAGTAYLALFTHGNVRPGETIVVLGAAGNVGTAVITLAAYAGARVIAVARRRDAEHCRAHGAAEVFDYTDDDLADRIKRASPRGVDIFIDTYGHNDLQMAVELLASRGRIVLLAGVQARPALPVGPFYMKDCAIHGFVISHATTAQLAEAATMINRLLADRRLRPRHVETLPLSEAAKAHRRMEDGELHGRRLVLCPS
ncbi:MAG TPA: NADPH:quinone reductase [Streptosporangiaceae bacterium]|nr:NADPH:quinone reductase [Streptosporangiaceae bacterium]